MRPEVKLFLGLAFAAASAYLLSELDAPVTLDVKPVKILEAKPR